MEVAFRGRRGSGGSVPPVVPEALHSVRSVIAMGHADPLLLAYHPVGRVNPYQTLLYRGFQREGVAPYPLLRLADLERLLPLASTGATVALHLHWTSVVLSGCADAEAAQSRVDAFLARLDAFRAAGGRVVWSIHNAYPHDAVFLDAETRLQQGLSDVADVVHVLTRGTAHDVASHLRVDPGKIVHSPLPSYRGAYPDHVSRDEARWTLGLDTDDTVYVLPGAIKPYKGLALLLEAFGQVRSRGDRRRRLIVAGPPDATAATAEFLARCREDPAVLLDARTVPVPDFQFHLRAADLAVLPYERFLNSSAAMLALTFGLPVVGTRSGGLVELLDESCSALFEAASVPALVDALLAGECLAAAGGSAAATDRAAQFPADRLGPLFARRLRSRLM